MNKTQIINSKIEAWENENARDLGLCCAKCNCGHCEFRRSIVNKILSQSLNEVWEESYNIPVDKKLQDIGYKLGYKKALEDVMGVIPKEREQEKDCCNMWEGCGCRIYDYNKCREEIISAIKKL
jgi:hypothetical protein